MQRHSEYFCAASREGTFRSDEDEAEMHLLAAAGLTGGSTGGRTSVRGSCGRPESEEKKGEIKWKEGVNGQKDEVLDTHK